MSLSRFQTKADPAAPSGTRKVHVVTFGCQMNKYDSLLAEGRFKRQGWGTTDTLADADVVLFNTCSVRDHAEERTYSWLGEIKHAKAKNPGLVIGVMGCMAQRVGEEIFARAGHVDLVAGTRQFARLPDLVEQVLEARANGATRKQARVLALEMDDPVAIDRNDEPWDGGHHAFLTVMRGCDLNCTYCIVPSVRGRVLSYTIPKLVEEARHFVDNGVKVVTLLGQTVNSYGEDFAAPTEGQPSLRGRQGRAGLADLLYELQGLRGLERIRLITLHPSYVTQALAEALRDCDKCDRFLPIPVQSGSDTILRAMKRGYTIDLFRRRMEILRNAVPDLEIGSDWIVGFPGETAADFEASEKLLVEQSFAVNYVFKYSPRPSTHAAENLADDVPEEVKKARNARLLTLGEQMGLKRHSVHVGGVRRSIVDAVSERDATVLQARTQHNMMVSFPGPKELVGTMVDVSIDSASSYGLTGTLVTPDRGT